MQAFLVRHKPSGKFLTSLALKKTETLRKTKGTVFLSRDHAEAAVNIATEKRFVSLMPKELHGSKKSDFQIKEFALDLNAIMED